MIAARGSLQPSAHHSAPHKGALASAAARIRRIGCVLLLMVGTAITAAAPAPAPITHTRPTASFKAPQASRAPMMAAARAGQRLVSVGDYGTVLLSDDSGQSWRQASHVATRETLTAVSFVDNKLGWAVGHGGVVLASTDGGENWEPRYQAGPEVVLFSVSFVNAQNGLAVGAFGHAMQTRDGGRTWHKTTVIQGEQADRHLYHIFAGPDATLWVTAEAGGLFRSDDGGDSFTAVKLPYKGSIWGGMALQGGALMVWGMRGHVLLSPDTGRSWRDVQSGTDQAFTAGLQRSSGELILVGLGGVVARSRDGGQTFSTEVRPERQSHTALVATDGGLPQSFTLTGIGGPLK